MTEKATIGTKEEGEEFGMVKPWMGSISEPTNYEEPPDLDKAPEMNLNLHHITGYRARDSRTNLHYISSTKFIFPAGAVVIIMDNKTKEQQFIKEHDDDVMSVDYLPKLKIAVSGQIGKNSKIVIFNPLTLEIIRIIEGLEEIKKGCKLVKISPSGKYIAALGLLNTLTLLELSTGKLIASSSTGGDRIYDMCFDGDSKLITCGKRHIKFWILEGTTLKSRNGVFGNIGAQQDIPCVLAGKLGKPAKPFVISGTLKGDLYLWQNGKVVKSIPIDSGKKAILSLYKRKDTIACGLQGGKVVFIRNLLLRPIIKDILAYKGESIRSVCLSPSAKIILGGTLTGRIFEITPRSEKRTIIRCHSSSNNSELWGLDVHPDAGEVVSGGDDCYLFLWTLNEEGKLVPKKSLKVQSKIRSCAYSPNGRFLAIGSIEGHVVIYDAKSLKKKFGIRQSKKSVGVLSFSPDSNFLAAGNHANVVELYSIGPEIRRAGHCMGASSYITAVDWSTGSEYIQCTTGDYSILYYSMPSCERILHNMRDVEWTTWTLPFGWPTQGIFRGSMDGTDINSVSRNDTQELLAYGDDFGQVSIVKYPCLRKTQKNKQYRFHSSHVTNVKWCGGYLITTGGGDGCIFVWKID